MQLHINPFSLRVTAAARLVAALAAAGIAATPSSAGAAPQTREAPPARPAPAGQAQPLTFDTSRIEALTGAHGAVIAQERVFKISVPRDDVAVQVDGVPIPPGMGVASWAGFSARKSGGLMVMGDLALFEDEVNLVLDEALAHSLSATALHNHFFFARPPVFFMHIAGEGKLEDLAAAVGKCLTKVKEIRAADPFPAGAFGYGLAPSPGDLPTAEIDSILHAHGELKEGVYKVVLGRRAAMHGVELGAAMGIHTWAAFLGGAADAVVDGDFAMREGEVQAVLKALRDGKINIVAIHNHMSGESPRLVFLHYWGRGPAASLARALRPALDLLKP